jgi:hypothetical protein
MRSMISGPLSIYLSSSIYWCSDVRVTTTISSLKLWPIYMLFMSGHACLPMRGYGHGSIEQAAPRPPPARRACTYVQWPRNRLAAPLGKNKNKTHSWAWVTYRSRRPSLLSLHTTILLSRSRAPIVHAPLLINSSTQVPLVSLFQPPI